MRKLTKAVSALLAFVMLMGVVLCAPFTVSASETDMKAKNPTYNMYSGFYYSNNFNYNTPSFAREYYNQLKSDTGFMASVTAWESAHIVTSPSYALESGMINMKDYYKTVIYDLLAQSDSDSGLDKLLNMANNKYLSYVSGVTKKIATAYEIKPSEFDKISVDDAITLTQETGLLKVASVSNVALKIAGWAKSAKDTVDAFAKYQAVSDLKDGTKQILEMIANDTNNPSQLRQAAKECIGYFGDGYDEVLNQILEGTRSIASFTFDIIADTALSWAWDLIIGSIATAGGVPVGTAILLGAKGAMLFSNVLFSTDKEIEAFYKIQAAVAFEDAIKNTIDNLRNNSNITTDDCDAYMYLKATEIFEKTILLGFDYSVDLLEVTGNSAWNKIFGGYSKCMNLIEQIKTFKDNKLNYFKTFEEKCFNAYNSQYCPDYNSLINGLNNQNIPIESITLKQTAAISVGDSGYIDDFISHSFAPTDYTEIPVGNWSSSDEKIIKFNADYYGDYLGDFEALSNGECILTCTLMSGVSQSITVTVGEKKQYEHNYDGDFEYEDVTVGGESGISITKYTGNSSKVIIPSYINGNKVLEISSAFRDCSSIKNVIIPNSAKRIGGNAFKNCTNIAGVTIPDSITIIGDSAFSGCTSLTSVTIPNSVRNIGSAAFAKCTNLEVVTVPVSTSLVSYSSFVSTFEGCTGIKSVTFSNGTDIWNINYYDTMKYIFPDSYDKIETVVFSQGVINIPNAFFEDCKMLNKVVLPDSVTSISESAFSHCTSLKSIIIPDSVETIGDGAFSHCTSLININLPNGLSKIENDTFNNCTSLKSIIIPDSVETIGGGAFTNCESLNDLTMPCSAVIGGSFYDCEKIEKITFSKGTGIMINYSSYNPKLPQYISSSSLKQVILEDGIENIGSYTFAYCDTLSECNIPDSVKVIGEGAFIGCSSFDIDELPSGMTCIGKKAFEGTKLYLDENNWTNGLLYIDDYLILGKSDLTGSITIKDGILLIADGALIGYHNNIDEIKLPESLLYIGKSAFACCDELEKIAIPKNVRVIGDDAFEDCRMLEKIFVNEDNAYYSDEDGVLFNKDKTTIIKYPAMAPVNYDIPKSVTEIYYCAFEWCVNLQNVKIPSTVTSIGDYAFFRCNNLATIDLPENLIYLGKQAFFNCSCLDHINIPNGITTIMNGTFSHCSKLSMIEIPAGVNTIGDSAFSSCSKLTTVLLPSTITTIGQFAFKDCTSIKILALSKNIKSFDSYAFLCVDSIEHVIFDGTKEEWELMPTKWYETSFDNAIFHYNEVVDDLFEENHIESNYFAQGYYTTYHCKICDIDITADYLPSILDFRFSEYPSGIRIDKYVGTDTNAVIPSYIDDYPVYKISKYAFSDCNSLVSVTIPKSVKEIEDNTFAGCTNLLIYGYVGSTSQKYAIENDLDFIALDGNYEYSILNNGTVEITGYNGSVRNLEIPNEIDGYTVTSIGDRAFFYCDRIVRVTIPSSVTKIGDSAFSNCYNLTNVVIPDSVISIGTFAFDYCNNLKRISIPKSVTYIGDFAFGYGANKIEDFTIYGYAGTAAEKFANNYDLIFMDLSPSKIYTDESTDIIVIIANDAELYIDKLTDSECAADVIAVLDESEKLADLYDISLTKDGVAIQPDEPATVKIPTDNENAKVYRIEDNGTKTDMNAVYNNGYMVFTTDHFSMYALVVPNDNVIIGDVNGDGDVDVVDAIVLQKYINKEAISINLEVADTNGDGNVNIKDATQIQKYIAKFVTVLG